MCFERDDCCNMASCVCELVAPAARPLRQFAQTVCWLAGTQPHTAKFACRLNGGRAAEQPRHQGESGWWGRKLAPGSAPDRLPVAGWRRAAGAEAARRPRAGHSQPLCDAAGGRGAGGAYSSLLLGGLAGLSSVVAPDRGLACRAAGNWQKMAHASSTQALAENSN